LFGIAFRIARRYADKHANRFEVLLDAPETSIQGANETDALVDRNRTRKRMVTALNQLDPQKRAAFVLCEVEGLSVP
ncbi:RNA polymerase sigma factor, partial [Vibrio parahaemolyticus]|uniref:RNA polymerase sigma factor n=1 Tax=Vibrio parahaemolyticus TaxID=670 RepID=UPI002113B596